MPERGLGHNSSRMRAQVATPPRRPPASGCPVASGIQVLSLTANMPLACLPIRYGKKKNGLAVLLFCRREDLNLHPVARIRP